MKTVDKALGPECVESLGEISTDRLVNGDIDKGRQKRNE